MLKMMMNKIMMDCEKAHTVCDKSQYKEATVWEKIKLKFHLVFCKICKKYTANNTKLTKLIKSNSVFTPLPKDAKEKIKSNFKKELAKLND